MIIKAIRLLPKSQSLVHLIVYVLLKSCFSKRNKNIFQIKPISQ